MTDLDAQLTSSASHFARSALEALPSGGHAIFALHAGTAIEHLSKALLARRHPALIAADDFDSLLHACGESAAAQKPAMRTINATVSVKRATRFLPRLANLQPQLEILADARNGVAHLGHSADAEELRIPFLKASEYLREELGLDRGEFWGDFEPLVDAALEESVQEARVRATHAIAAAQITFRARHGHLDEEAKQAVIQAIEANYYPPETDEQVVECPACGSPALAVGAVLGRWEMDPYDESGSFSATFIPGHLRCGICDLELDGEDEIQAAGIEDEWEVDVDPETLYDGWEPDWDLSR